MNLVTLDKALTATLATWRRNLPHINNYLALYFSLSVTLAETPVSFNCSLPLVLHPVSWLWALENKELVTNHCLSLFCYLSSLKVLCSAFSLPADLPSGTVDAWRMFWTLNLRQMSKLWQKWKRKQGIGEKRPKWIKDNTTYYMTNPGYWKVQMTGSRKGLLNPVTEPHKSVLVCFWKLNEKPSLALKPKDKCSRPDWHTCRVVGLRLFSCCWIAIHLTSQSSEQAVSTKR